MPKKAEEMGARKVGLLTAPGSYAVGGAPGLMLQVTNKRARSWVLRVTIAGRRREIGLGSFDDVTLAQARERARVMRAQVAEGVDPLEERRRDRMARTRVLTFDECTRRLIEAKAPEWRNAKHKRQWEATLAAYASPKIGKLPVDEIGVRDVERVLAPIWTDKTETAMRVRGRMEAVLAWATVAEYRTGDNPARWRHNLDKLMPKPSKVRKVKHHRALPVDKLPAFMFALRGRDGMAARALEFLILTAARSQEVRLAEWREIDLEAATWTVPAEHMKAGREHKVPLSPRAVRLLQALPRVVGSPLVFPAARGRPMSDMTLSAVMRRMEVDAVPHGFRSTFRDWAAERTNYPREVAEMALAHAIENKVEAAYRRGDLFGKRAKMMADWAKFTDTPPATGSVTPIRRKAG